jgi:hypothetical protein
MEEILAWHYPRSGRGATVGHTLSVPPAADDPPVEDARNRG